MPSYRGHLKDNLEKRLNKHHFVAHPPKLEEFQKLNSVNDVLDIEMKKTFRNLEDRLTFRLDAWIQHCKVPLSPGGKLPVDQTPSFRDGPKKQKTERKFKSISLGRMMSRSMENLESPTLEYFSIFSEEDKKKLQSKSSNDLLGSRQEIAKTANKYGTLPRKRFKIPWFKKKEKEVYVDGAETASISSASVEKSNKDSKKKHKKDKKKKHTDENANDDGNLRIHTAPSKSGKSRPSIFDMSLIKSDPLSNPPEGDSPFKRSTKNSRKKFGTVSGIESKENHFKDSFRTNHCPRQVKSYIPTDTLFYNPQPTEAEIGQI